MSGKYLPQFVAHVGPWMVVGKGVYVKPEEVSENGFVKWGTGEGVVNHCKEK